MCVCLLMIKKNGWRRLSRLTSTYYFHNTRRFKKDSRGICRTHAVDLCARWINSCFKIKVQTVHAEQWVLECVVYFYE